MTNKQIDHVESQLLKVLDRIAEKENATVEEIEALSKVAFALAEIHKLP